MLSPLLLLLPLGLLAFVGCGKKKKKPVVQTAATATAAKPPPAGGTTATTGTKDATTTVSVAKTSTTATAGSKMTTEKKENAEQVIADAIKNGDLLPPNDNETINDCESNWGQGANDKKE